MKILVIEDDKSIRDFVTQGFKEEGHSVAVAADGKTGLEMAESSEFDFLILDVMLPKLNGLEICRRLRQQGKTMPILMLTALDSVEKRVEGLDAGADDYLVKPFSFSELLARVRAVGRRKSGDGSTVLEEAGLKIDSVRHKVTYQNKEIDLTSREFSLLSHFMKRKGHVLSRTMIIEAVWGYDFQANTNVIDVYINFLRRKLRKLTGLDWIRTVRNRGYVFDEPSA